MRTVRSYALICVGLGLGLGAWASCDGQSAGPPALAFPAGFHFGAATAAHQLEGDNANNNWHQFETLPGFAGKTREPSGKAVDGYRQFDGDAALVQELGLSHYRFSIEWSRVEPKRGVFSEEALAHYDAVLDSLKRRGIRPTVTLHHFTDPVWVFDLRELEGCMSATPPIRDENLCGWTNPTVVEEWLKFVEKVVARYGDRVDTWVTFNEPMAFIPLGYLYGAFPPGLAGQSVPEVVVPLIRNVVEAHARAYDLIKRLDQKDADGDGTSSFVGLAQSVSWWVPADAKNAEHRAAAEQGEYFSQLLMVDALAKGGLDTNLDGTPDEAHPSWKGKQDFVGLQYYYVSATTKMTIFPPLTYAPCNGLIESVVPGALKLMKCPTPDPNKLTLMGYEHEPQGLYQVGKAFAKRFPALPLVITENGISTRSGKRRAESLVRHLEQAHRLVAEGVDLRGYYHWALLDNYEWTLAFEQPFGLYRVDRTSMRRIATEGADAYRAVTLAGGVVTEELRRLYGGEGPLTPEPTR
ncbi:MAG: glycoside hydrolase family 1 protein [Deltaproteobacteria bacterium]|nr:glycoside hydrolase family 1 protein [Deltaproteobacteria bacterium]